MELGAGESDEEISENRSEHNRTKVVGEVKNWIERDKHDDDPVVCV